MAVDRQDRVYVFNRGDNPMMIFDRDGSFVDTWGAGQFQRAHGVYVAPDGNLFLVDDLDHSVTKTTTSGEVLMILGNPGQPAEWQQGRIFNRPTDAWISPMSGDLLCKRRIREFSCPSLSAGRQSRSLMGRAGAAAPDNSAFPIT